MNRDIAIKLLEMQRRYKKIFDCAVFGKVDTNNSNSSYEKKGEIKGISDISGKIAIELEDVILDLMTE